MRVLFAAVEMSPLAKVGGLADVAGSLPKALVRLGHDVRVILPLHQGVDTPRYRFQRTVSEIQVPTPRGPERVDIWQGVVDGVTTYLVEQMDMFERPYIYGEPDDAQRFLFFSDAVLAAAPRLGWLPEVLHLHDWHSAFIAARLRADPSHPLARAASVYTIHNLALRGDFDDAFVEANGLVVPVVEGMDVDNLRNGMALGILCADIVSTVSVTYAREILTPEFGAGLDPLLRQRAGNVFGIVNGIDPEAFDPAHDPHLAAPFSAADPTPKREDKAALQREAGLPVDEIVPLIGVVNRLFWQKGMDIAAAAIGDLLPDQPLQLVVLGTGDERYERQLTDLAARYPRAIKVWLEYNPPVGQRIYAGSDMFLMPSRYEPCGLGQMIAMRYGSVPVVRATGGLVDTVSDADQDPETGVGFRFEAAEPAALAAALRRAVRAFHDRERWRAIVRRGMTRDFSWHEAAPKYVDLYARALATRAAQIGSRA